MDHYLAEYGYWAIVLFVAVEYLGIPFPGETILVAAGVYAGHTHHLSLTWIVVSAAAAAIGGGTVGYVIGVKGGYPLLRRYGHYLHIDDGRIKLGRYLFLRHGGKVVFFGRFVSVLRTYAAFLAGTNRMPWLRFTIFNAASGAVWATLFGVGSYEFGNAIWRVSGDLGIGLAAVAVVAVIAGILFVRSREAHLLERAEAAFPGPLDAPPPAAAPAAAPAADPAPADPGVEEVRS
jgi:membrane protein DedA with SNARE-associated domain